MDLFVQRRFGGHHWFLERANVSSIKGLMIGCRINESQHPVGCVHMQIKALESAFLPGVFLFVHSISDSQSPRKRKPKCCVLYLSKSVFSISFPQLRSQTRCISALAPSWVIAFDKALSQEFKKLEFQSLLHSPFLPQGLCNCCSPCLRCFLPIVQFFHLILVSLTLTQKPSLTVLYKIAALPHTLEPLSPLTYFILLPGPHHYLIQKFLCSCMFTACHTPSSPIRAKLCPFVQLESGIIPST